MDCIGMRVMALFCDPCRDVVNRDDPVEDRDADEDQQPEREIAQERVPDHLAPTLSLEARSKKQAFSVQSKTRFDRGLELSQCLPERVSLIHVNEPSS